MAGITQKAHGPIKMVLMGDSGGGKSGALLSLAAAGYKLRILDTDNGTDIIGNILNSPKNPYGPSAINNIDIITITEKMKKLGNTMVPAQAKAWGKCLDLFDKWKDDTIDYGSIFSWDADTILVIDSLSSLCNFAMNVVLAINSRLGQQPFQSDWGEAQRMVEAVLQTIYDKSIQCNVIMICHIVYIGAENLERGYPNTLGKALSPRVGRYFNTALLAQGMKIHTKTQGLVDLKNSSPLAVPASYPLQTGLADYFLALRGIHPNGAKAPLMIAVPTVPKLASEM